MGIVVRVPLFGFLTTIMPKRNKKRGKKTRKASSSTSRGPPVSAVVYRGPVVPRPRSVDQDMYVRRFTNYGGVQSFPLTGQISIPFVNSPVGYTEFSAVAGLYQEYRTLAQRVRWIPSAINYPSTASAILQGPLVFGVNRNAGTGTPNNILLASSNTDIVLGHTQTRMSKSVRAGSAQEMLFLTTATPAGTWTIYLLSDPILTVSQTYGYFLSELLVQFRNTV